MCNISAIVPYYNEDKVIEFTFKRLIEQTLQPKEIIFVNSNSTDNSFITINNFINNYQGNISILNLDTNCKTPSDAKNFGIKKSNYELIAFMDCDMDFPKNWLEIQFRHIKQINKPISLGQVNLTGKSLIDRCSVIHTYGYNRSRPCIPSSIVNKNFFYNNNYFENFNALYDQKWIKTNVSRGFAEINSKINIKYLNYDYAKDYRELIKKIIYYSLPTLKIYGLLNINLIGLISLISIIVLFPHTLFPLIILYLLIRNICIPVVKSNYINVFKYISYRFDVLIFTSLIIDISKVIGIFLGIIKRKIIHYQR